eukprot:CAMPEP_0185733500 /NCGR_PEP_ID=MMETSP1171-20130828/19699_1 /TAXON_ID=374046 /ORGANISM="Helicotheca tamensis, Strain CCMP826" /LENGTH=241 /DNA_ID=CAMNT_0028403253 /DNA_START=180 /DNA_END=905 /DNA_ORIENTATION=-
MSSQAGPSDGDESNIGLGDIKPEENTKNNDNEESQIKTWRERIAISIAKSRKVRGGNYVQIATVDPSTNEPRCRTVVFRGFLPGSSSKDESCVMKMITDDRSSKVAEVSTHPEQAAELVWWFSKSSEQYRIRGKVQFVGGGKFDKDDDDFYVQARKQQWGNMSDMAREQFYWKEPGVPYTPQAEVPAGGRGEDGKVLAPPDNFLLMLLYPKRVDYLRLGDNFRQIDEIDDDEVFKPLRVNP